jgi:hypothetical protein
MTGYGPDGVDSLRSRRLPRVTDLSCASPMCGAASDVTFPPATTGVIARMGILHSGKFRVDSGRFHPACPDEGRERSREGSLRLPHPSPISNRELTMRQASSSRARPFSGRRGICFSVSNRELDLLERKLNHCKQRTATASNRELSTIRNSTITVVQPAQPRQGSQPPPRKWRSRPAISDANFRPLGPFLTGSASQTEIAVTPSKQTLATFLTGSRIAHMRFAAWQVQP